MHSSTPEVSAVGGTRLFLLAQGFERVVQKLGLVLGGAGEFFFVAEQQSRVSARSAQGRGSSPRSRSRTDGFAQK